MGKQMPLKYLPIFGRLLTEMYPTGYTGRPNYGVHIRYFEKFNTNLSIDDIRSMFGTGMGKLDSFREWLLGSFEPETDRWNKDREPRPSDCNIPDDYHLTYKELSVLWEPGFRKTWYERKCTRENI